jgi:hypothetical protein
MDKLQAWLRRIQQPPRREVANLDYWALLAETRISQEAGLPPERLMENAPWARDEKTPRRTAG